MLYLVTQDTGTKLRGMKSLKILAVLLYSSIKVESELFAYDIVFFLKYAHANKVL